jgi:hypothetical protein
VKIELLQNQNITGLGQQKAGAIVDVSDFVGRFYIGLGVAIQHTPLPEPTPKPPVTPANPATPTTQPKQTYPIVNKHPGSTVYVDTTKPEVHQEEKKPMPEPKAKALPSKELPGEQLIRDAGPVKT